MQMSLEAARINAGYSQKEAGELFGVHYQTIAKWEKDNSAMPFDQIQKYQASMECPQTAFILGQRTSLFVY